MEGTTGTLTVLQTAITFVWESFNPDSYSQMKAKGFRLEF